MTLIYILKTPVLVLFLFTKPKMLNLQYRIEDLFCYLNYPRKLSRFVRLIYFLNKCALFTIQWSFWSLISLHIAEETFFLIDWSLDWQISESWSYSSLNDTAEAANRINLALAARGWRILTSTKWNQGLLNWVLHTCLEFFPSPGSFLCIHSFDCWLPCSGSCIIPGESEINTAT